MTAPPSAYPSTVNYPRPVLTPRFRSIASCWRTPEYLSPSSRLDSAPFAMASTATFLDLPAEVIILIVRLLPLREVVACKRLCRRLRSLIEDSQLLQYHLRAMSNGVEDLFLPGISSHEFLRCLEQWEMAWQKFDIGERFARHRYQNILWTVEHIVQNGHIIAMRLMDSSWLTTPGWSYADISRVLLQGGESQALSWIDTQGGEGPQTLS